ncbi:Acyl-coenzyme A thioesterase [Hyphodiscus hymeniophilus]|uniref:Acyl-coenzyme A thioesterase n=1 Tax=Hyphodiscus hymeniophilus TaxID=353542 RepID=A0A9P6VDX2_9HELO|nr:Acyl-coenzyme A thioesterase [Hyphodiscus hymeniophilus]
MSTSSTHGQFTPEPLNHFKEIPWCAKLLSDKRIVHIAIPDRRPKLDDEYTLVKETLNGENTVRACITYFRVPPRKELRPGEDQKNPFVEMNTLLDVGGGVNGYAKTCHGGFITTIFDELMGTAAWQQSGEEEDNGAYTISMNLKFKKPLFTPAVVRCTGGVVKKEGRKITVEAVLVGEDGAVHAEAQSVFLEMKRNIGKAQEVKYGTVGSKL